MNSVIIAYLDLHSRSTLSLPLNLVSARRDLDASGCGSRQQAKGERGRYTSSQ